MSNELCPWCAHPIELHAQWPADVDGPDDITCADCPRCLTAEADDMGLRRLFEVLDTMARANPWLEDVLLRLACLPHDEDGKVADPSLEAVETEQDPRAAVVSGALEHLLRSYTTAGAMAWWGRPHPQLDGRTPADLLDHPSEHQRIIDVAEGSRASDAS